MMPILPENLKTRWPQNGIEYRFLQQLGKKEREQLEKNLFMHEEKKTEKKILCRFCNNPVTSPDQIIAVHNRHVHSFVNPSGISYTIGCFLHAPGCVAEGIPTTQHSWFHGYSWKYTLCNICLRHLGWFYQNGSGNDSFFGLIINNLIE